MHKSLYNFLTCRAYFTIVITKRMKLLKKFHSSNYRAIFLLHTSLLYRLSIITLYLLNIYNFVWKELEKVHVRATKQNVILILYMIIPQKILVYLSKHFIINKTIIFQPYTLSVKSKGKKGGVVFVKDQI